MIRLKELKTKKYNPNYEELYKFLYSISIDIIIDKSQYEIEPDGLNIIIRDKMPEEFRIQKVLNCFIVTIELIDNERFLDCEYQKLEYYGFKSISSLIKGLKDLLNKHSNIITIEYDKRPHKATYDLLTYAKLDFIADDSTWMSLNNDNLRITLTDDQLDKLIFIDYTKGYYYEPYMITYFVYDVDYDDKDEVKLTFKSEDDMLEKLKELIAPFIKKRRLRDIGTRYHSTIYEMNKYCSKKTSKKRVNNV